MSIRNLNRLFEPRSVAVIGASMKEGSVGTTVLKNLLSAGYVGKIIPVNPKYRELQGLETYAGIHDLPQTPDLAVICTPPASVPGLIAELGARGTRAAIVLTAGLGTMSDADGVSLKARMLQSARPHLMRILGPNCVGLLVPRLGLNASFAHTNALPGKLAFVSQSGALVTGVLDWAKTRGIGFSKFISLGDGADVDFGDLLDYLASDGDTHAVLLYMEDLRAARKFMSAARAAARSKPVIVIKAGRVAEAAQAAASHTGALAGADDVYDAAIRRAGMLRVLSTEDLFSAVETLANVRPMDAGHLTIITNGGGPGVMATDALICGGGKLATLSDETLRKLDEVLPSTWSRSNPVDIIGDASGERYAKAMQILLHAPESDSILFIHAPTAVVSSADVARSVVPLARNSSRNIVACWLGGDTMAEARRYFADAAIPNFDTPEAAVEGFMQIVRYKRNQDLLTQAPPSMAAGLAPDREDARKIVRDALACGRTMLSEPEAKNVLAAYGIPVADIRIAATPQEAAQAAHDIGFPVAVKILSPDITHKTEVGGVALDLETGEAVMAAAAAMRQRLAQLRPDARLSGFSVQSMVRRPDAHELIVGVATDAVFGPVVLFGQGGIAVEVMNDHVLGLPPLNRVLAHDMISRTRVAKLLAGYRNRPPADLDAISLTLVRISQLVIDLPEVLELDINPLIADAQGVVALDARVRIAAAPPGSVERLAIRPYPDELEKHIVWDGRPLLLRPIRPEDSRMHVEFFHALDPDDVRARMFIRTRELQPSQLARLTQIDYDREMAFIAEGKGKDGAPELLGVARAIFDPDNIAAEFAVIVRSDMKGRGLGTVLMQYLISYCRERGTSVMVGEALAGNLRIAKLVRKLGFVVDHADDPGTMTFRMRLDAAPLTSI